MSRRILYAAAVLMVTIAVSSSARPGKFSAGFNVLFGGRYDDLRMCVASPAGVKGGIIADVQFTMHYWVKDDIAVGMKIPVMRPILFAAAFKMLQFEPEITLQYKKEINKDVDFVFEPSIGASFHYGPDYETEKNAKNPDSFFAAGPLVGALTGIGWHNDSNLQRFVGIKPFYIPLFSKDRSTGTIIGAVLEGNWDFAASD